MPIEGLYTALITPFDENGTLNLPGLQTLIEYQIQGQVDGITLLGTTGESPTIEKTERIEIIRTAVIAADKRIPVMVGCGTYCTKTTIAQAIEAEQLGASSLLIVVPYYNRPTQEGLYQHFKEVTEAVSLPICVYNIASRTGQNLEISTLERLSELPGITAIKEASGNIVQMMDVIERIVLKKEFFRILSGDDILTLALSALGGHGVISVLSNLIPRTIKELLISTQVDIEKARALHYSIKPLIQAAFIETNPIPIKYMMQLAGLPAGPTRLPLSNLTAVNQQKLQEIITQYQQLIKNNILTCKEIPILAK